MMNTETGLVLVAVDPKALRYTRYAGCAGNKAKLIHSYQSDRPLTPADVEMLRATPQHFDPSPAIPQVA